MHRRVIQSLFAIIFILLLSLLQPFPALAYQEIYQGITFTVTMVPSEITAQQTTSATITITSDKPFFVSSNPYGFAMQPFDNLNRTGDPICTKPPRYGTVKSDTTAVFDLSFLLSDLDSCLHKESRNWVSWTTKFWVGNPARPENIFIKNFTFTVLPPGGAEPKIYAANSPLYFNDDPIVHITNLKKGQDYVLWWDDDWGPAASNGGVNDSKWTASDVNTDKTLKNPDRGKVMKKTLKIAYGSPLTLNGVQPIDTVEFFFTSVPNPSTELSCAVKPSNKVDKNQPVEIEIKNPKANTDYTVKVFDSNNISLAPFTVNSGTTPFVYIPLGKLFPDTYKAQAAESSTPSILICPKLSIQVGPPSEKIGGGCIFGAKDCAGSAGIPITNCSVLPDPNDPTKTIPDPNPGIATAIGCIHTNPDQLAKDFLAFGIGIGGGLSFLMMLFGAFQMMTSAGNPETLNAGRQRLTSAIIGLLFVILSILFLQIIGWNILQLPGFGTK